MVETQNVQSLFSIIVSFLHSRSSFKAQYMIIIDFSFCDYFSFILLKLITCFKNILSRVAYDSKRKSTLLKEVRPLLQRRPPFPPGMQRRMMPGMPPQNGFGQQPGNFGQFNPLQQFRNFAQQTNAQQSFYPNQQGLNRGGGNFLTRLFRRGGNRNIPFNKQQLLLLEVLCFQAFQEPKVLQERPTLLPCLEVCKV